MQIRAYLFLMAAGILIPVIVFSGLALNMLQDAEKAAALRGLNETARGVALLVDRELYSAEAALRVLAASPALAQRRPGRVLPRGEDRRPRRHQLDVPAGRAMATSWSTPTCRSAARCRKGSTGRWCAG